MSHVRSRPSIHEKVLEKIYERIASRENSVAGKNLSFNVFSEDYKVSGELDLLDIRQPSEVGGRKYAVVVEVKQSDNSRNRKKAISQLERDEKVVKHFFGEDYRVFKVYAYSHKTLRKRRPEKPYIVKWIR